MPYSHWRGYFRQSHRPVNKLNAQGQPRLYYWPGVHHSSPAFSPPPNSPHCTSHQ
ncbi:hypothetical protein SERLADRAFT_471469 [Serpula lacrymans var. lacrymans S7.9]|uniref:Uncharacterized protein n=1 Tax=Serpula lacrymans var. lacrymans (strain S7.9) TaxID=578457 RepID=F8P1A8_SERL9|nr:uncharacterized protein SERLADRAFT_471469 [Serpula lacrymans var. lacrymans S7.9]EGO22938.1 hypothetical protein SERLADRAFT_471469 [Serpula lacrymans var. lacrymans S7.9]